LKNKAEDLDIPYLELFIDRYSNPNHAKNKIVNFAGWCKEEYDKNILEINMTEFKFIWNNYIKNRPGRKDTKIGKSAKKIWFNYINQYYEVIDSLKEQFEKEKRELDPLLKCYYSPIPPKKLFTITGKSNSFEDLETPEELLTIERVRFLVKKFYYVHTQSTLNAFWELELYLAFQMIIYSGARISEVCHLEFKNIDLKNRWFITTVKSKKSDKRDGVYFFPEFFVPELRYYIRHLKEEYGNNPKYFFPNKKSKKGYLTKTPLEKRLKDLKENLDLEYNTNPHAFRDFLNTKRMEMRLPKDLCTMLLNQKPKGVNPQHYLKKFNNRVHLRDLYDQYNPFREKLSPDIKSPFLL
jgi:integrase